MIEVAPKTVVVSTMSCNYYKVNLKSGNAEVKVQGFCKHAVDLIRAPIFDKPAFAETCQKSSSSHKEKTETSSLESEKLSQCPKFCGIESNCIVLIDFEKQERKVLQEFEKTEFKSPWYSATFFLKDKNDFLVVGDEQLGTLRCFQIQNQYVDTSNQGTQTTSTTS